MNTVANKNGARTGQTQKADYFSLLKRHFLRGGQKYETRHDLALVGSSRLFDAGWYLKTYPDIARVGIDPLEHYVDFGGKEGRDPSPWFQSAWYLKTYKDVDNADVNPLLHFLQAGHREGRLPMSKAAMAKVADPTVYDGLELNVQAGPEGDTAEQVELIRGSDLFDAAWYLKTYRDVAEAGIDPAEHYLMHGGFERRHPGPKFDSGWYLSAHAAARESKLNPLIHYLRTGKAAGLEPMMPLRPAPLSRTRQAELGAPAREAPELPPLVAEPEPMADADEPDFDGVAPDEMALGNMADSGTTAQDPPEAVVVDIGPPAATAVPAPPPPAAPVMVAADTPTPVAAPPADGPSREEQQAIDTALVASSDLFDARWYLATYTAVAKEGFDPAFHYVRFGAFEGKNPSIRFDSNFYLDSQPGLREAEINPLVHYLREGKAAGLKPLAVLQFEVREEAAPVPGPAFSYPGDASWPLQRGEAHIFVTEHQIGLRFMAESSKAEAVSAYDELIDTIIAFCELSGIESKQIKVQYQGDSKPFIGSMAAKLNAARVNTLTPHPHRGEVSVADVWMTTDYDMRLRLDVADRESVLEVDAEIPHFVRLYQFDGMEERKLVSVGCSTFLREALSFVDAGLVNPFMPVLLAVTNRDGLLLDVQILPFPSLCRGGCHYGELSYAALSVNSARQLRLYSDALLHEWAERDLGGFAVTDLVVSGGAATGQERIFTPSFLKWLGTIAGVRAGFDGQETDDVANYLRSALAVELSPEAQSRCDRRRREGSLRLVLPSDALPTLAVLMSRRLSLPAGHAAAMGSYVVCDTISAAPRCAVPLPVFDDALLSLQPKQTAPGCAAPYIVARDQAPTIPGHALTSAIALALRFGSAPTHSISMVLPRAVTDRPVVGDALTPGETDAIRIRAVVSYRDGDDLMTFSASLKNQSLSDCIEEITFVRAAAAPPGSDVEKSLGYFFPSRVDVRPARSFNRSRSLNEAVATCPQDYVLFCDASILLPDARTLDCLYKMLQPKDVATSSCVILHDRPTRGEETVTVVTGGYFPSQVSLIGGPSLTLGEPDCLAALPDMTYPVVGNSFRLAMVKTAAWREANGFDAQRFPGPQFDIDFCLRASRHGWRHLATSAVRAVSGVASSRSEFVDVFAGSFLPTPEWQETLQTCTLVRELT